MELREEQCGYKTVSKANGLDMKERAIPERKSREGPRRTPGFLAIGIGFTDMKKTLQKRGKRNQEFVMFTLFELRCSSRSD